MTKIISSIEVKDLTTYGSLKVGFYDSKNPSYNPDFKSNYDENCRENKITPDYESKSYKNTAELASKEYLTYIHIQDIGDTNYRANRAAGIARVDRGGDGVKNILEIEHYKAAYDKYKAKKESGEKSESEIEIEMLRRENAALKASATKPALPPIGTPPSSPALNPKPKKPVKEEIVKKNLGE